MVSAVDNRSCQVAFDSIAYHFALYSLLTVLSVGAAARLAAVHRQPLIARKCLPDDPDVRTAVIEAHNLFLCIVGILLAGDTTGLHLRRLTYLAGGVRKVQNTLHVETAACGPERPIVRESGREGTPVLNQLVKVRVLRLDAQQYGSLC